MKSKIINQNAKISLGSMTFYCRLLTPERTLFEQEMASLSLPTEAGDITILPEHVALTSVLAPGIAHFIDAAGNEQELAVSNGFIQIAEGGAVTILANTAERGEELDLDIIDQAKKRAEEVMRQAIGRDDVSFAAASAGLKRELARERLAMRHRARRQNIPESS